MRVLVFEAGSGGHSLNYHRLLLPAVAEFADELVVVLRKDAVESEFAKVQLRAMPSKIRWEPSVRKPTGPLVQRQLAFRHAMRDAIARHKPDHVYVPTADPVSQLSGVAAALGQRDIPRRTEAEAALHRCGFAYPTTSGSKRAIRRLGFWAHAHAPWTRLFNVDVLAYEWVQKYGGELARRTFLLPDPIELGPDIDRHEARHRLNVPCDGTLIGCVGAINERKGIDCLLAAFKKAQLPPAARPLLAGNHEPRIRDLLKHAYDDLVRAGRIVSIDRYLSVDELQQALGAMDLVCTPYMHQIAIASITLRAVASNRPVLAANDGWCGRMVPAFGMGWTSNPRNAEQFATAIRASLEAAPSWHRSEACNRLLRFHAPENFTAIFTQRLRERTGRPPLPPTITWPEVQQSSAMSDGTP
jgi:glycosyltransferase involved in cell wall biosynthesis